MQVYRLTPVLWQRRGGDPQQSAWTVYAIDRTPAGALSSHVCVEARAPGDPVCAWEGSTWVRVRLPPDAGGGSCGGANTGDAVTWAKLPALLSWLLGNGYALLDSEAASRATPTSDLWITYTAP